MPVARFQMPDGRVARFEVPEGTTPEQAQSMIATSLQSTQRQPTETPQAPPEREVNPVIKAGRNLLREGGNLLSDKGIDIAAPILTGMTGLMRGGANLLFNKGMDLQPGQRGLGDVIWPPAPESEGTVARTVGEFMDPVAWGIGGGVMKALPYAPVFARKVGSQVIPGGGARAAAQNAAGGAAMGGAIGTLSEDGSTLGGAGVGAGLNVLLPPAISGIGKGIGKVVDFFSPTRRAGKLIRDVAGKDITSIKAALANAPEGLTAAQAAEGVKSDTWSALGEFVKSLDKESFFSRLEARQKQELVDTMTRVAGGATQTEARQTAEATQKALNRIAGPMRETELGAANTAGKVGADLQAQADALRRGAFRKGTDVRRLSEAQQIAEDLAQSGRARLDDRMLGGNPPAVGLPRISGRYAYGTELADVAERIAQLSADDSVILGTRARFKQMQVDSLAAHGLKPLDGGAIIRALEAKIADPSIGSETLKENVLIHVKGRFSQWTKAGGVIDSAAIYGIRKSAVNDAIEQLMGGADPKAKSKAAAGILNEIKPMIDDAIEAAGGTGWRDYLKTFEAGMHQVDQQKMGAKALRLLQKSPGRFEELVAGNEPNMVNKVFQTEYDISKAMGDKFIPMQGVAETLRRDREIGEAAAKGAGGLKTILDENGIKFQLPNWINAKIAVTNRALVEIQGRVAKKTMNKVYESMKTGKTAYDLLSTIPPSERRIMLESLVAARRAMPYVNSGIVSAQQGE